MTPSADACVRALLRRAPEGTGPLVVVRAPGRVNLIGEHTDYNGLPVLPMAIDRAVYVAARALPEPRVAAYNLERAFPPCTFACAPGVRRSPRGHWANYLKAAVRELAADDDPRGMAVVVASDLPRAAGLSSSAALVVATALALAAVRELAIAPLALAERLARAERFVGTLSGGMDQAVVLLARDGAALRIDFFPLRAAPVPLPPGHAIVVCDSLERATKAGEAQAAYNRRVVECRLATRVLAHVLRVPLQRLGDLPARLPGTALPGLLDALADALPDRPLTLADVARHCDTSTAALIPLLRDPTGRRLALGPTDAVRPFARARHVLTEAARVDAAVQALGAGDAARFGVLMAASHRSCRDDYAISTPALEALVAAADAAGALGARLTGAGFGGCTVNLVPTPAVDEFLARMDRAFYAPRLPPGAPAAAHRFALAAASGAEVTRVEAPLTPAGAP